MVTADKSNSSADAAKSDDVINLTSSESQDEVLAALRYGDLKVTISGSFECNFIL
jgi:hypothetical protein